MVKLFAFSKIKITIFQKLLIGIIGMLILNGVIAFVGIMSIKKLENTAKILLEDSKEHNDLQTLKLNFLQLLSPSSDYLSHGNKIEIQNFEQIESILKSQIIKCKKYSGIHFKESFIDKLENNFNEVVFYSNAIFDIENPIGNVKGTIIMEDIEAITNKVINDLDKILLKESVEIDKYLNKNKATDVIATRIIIIIGLILSICLIVGGYFYVKEITQPIKHLSQLVKRVSLGDLSTKENVFTRTRDEIKDFSKLFNKMIRVLEKTTVSKVYFDNVLNKMVDSIIITDINGIIRIINQSTLDLLGYNEKEIIGQSISMILINRNDKKQKTIEITENINEENEKNIYNIYYSKTGNPIPVSFSRSIMNGRKKRKISGVLCIAQPIQIGHYFDQTESSDKLISKIKNIKTIGKIPLTNRELEIIKLISLQFTNNEIAHKICISVRTVETHRKNIMRKLHTKNVISLVNYASQNGII